MIDIVVTYLNERDEKWRKEFEYWKEVEIQEGRTKPDNRQAFGEERTREWDCFKYWFRGIEENCPWVNKVFLVVQNERHIPEWINKENPKLRIVYHNEFIPEGLLPTFNAMTIAMYISNIPDLSENYIMCDDDYYFLNSIKEDRFFHENKPVHENNAIIPKLYGDDLTKTPGGVFYSILNNNFKFEMRFMMNNLKKYNIYHLPEARKKSFEQKILNEYKDEIYYANKISKFRHEKNLCAYMFSDLLKICNEAYYGLPYDNCKYVTLKSTVNFDEYKDKDIVCFNDTEQLDDYDKTKEKFIEFLDNKFPNKCDFEI